MFTLCFPLPYWVCLGAGYGSLCCVLLQVVRQSPYYLHQRCPVLFLCFQAQVNCSTQHASNMLKPAEQLTSSALIIIVALHIMTGCHGRGRCYAQILPFWQVLVHGAGGNIADQHAAIVAGGCLILQGQQLNR